MGTTVTEKKELDALYEEVRVKFAKRDMLQPFYTAYENVERGFVRALFGLPLAGLFGGISIFGGHQLYESFALGRWDYAELFIGFPVLVMSATMAMSILRGMVYGLRTFRKWWPIMWAAHTELKKHLPPDEVPKLFLVW